jgi:H+-translocating diphosphatase
MKLTTVFSDSVADVGIPLCAVTGIAFAIFLWYRVSQIKVRGLHSENGREYLLEEEQRGESEVSRNCFITFPASTCNCGPPGLDGLILPRTGSLCPSEIEESPPLPRSQIEEKVAELQRAISEGANSFLFTEYKYVSVFMGFFSVIIFVLLSSEDGFSSKWVEGRAPGLYNGAFSTIAFIVGAATSIVSGYLGMAITTYANARTALEARKGVAPAFMAAFRSGAVMGFLLAGNALMVLFVLIHIYKRIYGDDWEGLFEAITGYGLGGSAIALFGRVGGGIYTKAADVGADLVGKVEKDIPEDDPRNPAVIADNVGDNVGDIAGMGADLFGSFAESTCAALVVSSVSALGTEHLWISMLFPLLITGSGILVCMATTLIATDFKPARVVSEIESTLKMQLIVSTTIMTPIALLIALCALPASFTGLFGDEPERAVKNWHIFFCVAAGLWGGLIIGLTTEYFTSNRFQPVQDVADSCKTGPATDVIFGLALGYKSSKSEVCCFFCRSVCLVCFFLLLLDSAGKLPTEHLQPIQKSL